MGMKNYGWMALGAALLLWSSPAEAHKEKRTDPCGCHHQWGLRHCHPKKKSPRCEAPVADVKTKTPSEQKKRRVRSPAPRKDGQGIDL